MFGNDDKRLRGALLVGTTIAVALVAALAAWASHLVGGARLPVLTAFVLVLAVPGAMLISLRNTEGDELPEVPAIRRPDPIALVEPDPAPSITRRAS